jgi:DNA sulfur modification protein DndD
MRIRELTLNNFMPYRGEHHLQLPADSRKNVTVVFGENMRGKTSLLNAIRWCLYGEALDRDRKPIARSRLANMDAASEGDWRFAVHVKFEANEIEYDLRRTAALRDYVHTPRRDSDFEIDLQLRKGSRAVRADEIEHEINQLLPHQTSRFFLFDAELLAEYQELLAEDSEQGRRIREAIEQVLGVPALVNGKAELRALLKKAQDVLAKENRHTEGMRAQSEHFTKLQGELDVLYNDAQKLKAKEDSLRDELGLLEISLAQTEGAQKLYARVEGLRSEQRRLKERSAAFRQEKLDIVGMAWKDVLQPRLRAHVARREQERSAFQARLEKRGELRSRIAQLKSILKESACAVCEQPIAETQREKFGTSLGTLEGELSAIASDLDRVGHISAEISQLSKIGGISAATRLKAVETDLNRIAVDLTKIESELSEAEQLIKGFDTAEVARQRARRDHLLQNLGGFQEDISRTQNAIDDREAKKDQLSRLMAKTPSARTQRSAKEVEIYSGLEHLFSRSVDLLRDRLRESVERHATAAFLRLTTEKTYRGLRINESYGLTIIDRDGRSVSVRSAGAEQIVALSLIDGLNRTARKTGPIIIDTPLGRLDPRHRTNVLEYVPRMAEQIVLFVHEGEIEKGRGMEPLSKRIGAVYEIQRVTSSHSRIARL